MGDCLVQLAAILNFCLSVLLDDDIKKKCHAQKKSNFQPTHPPTPKIQNGSIELKICRETKFKSDERPVLGVD